MPEGGNAEDENALDSSFLKGQRLLALGCPYGYLADRT